MKGINLILALSLIGVFLFLGTVSAAATPAYNATCMQNALLMRETAIGNAYGAFIGEIQASFAKRSQGLYAAYGIEDAKARRDAVKAVWAAYKDEYKTSAKTLKDARKATWKTFADDVKLCKGKREAHDQETNELKV